GLVKSLQVSHLDRASSLSECVCEIGKEKRHDYKGIHRRGVGARRLHCPLIWMDLGMNSGRSPKLPAKPPYIGRDLLASAEWDRICGELRNNPRILEVGQQPIASAASLYAGIARMDELLKVQGRTPDNKPMADDQAHVVSIYLRYMTELEVEPGPIVRLRRIE
ncbi:MAG TPA: hypothetical protein VKP13_17445, partial [Nitrospira sp.]|nr:hypothetical protein [Nitrospira sp.]